MFRFHRRCERPRFYKAFYLSTDSRDRDVLWVCASDYHGKSLVGFFAYVEARLNKEYEQLLFMNYCANALQTMVENTALFAGGKVINKSFYELLEPKEEENVNAEQIIDKVLKQSGLEVV